MSEVAPGSTLTYASLFFCRSFEGDQIVKCIFVHHLLVKSTYPWASKIIITIYFNLFPTLSSDERVLDKTAFGKYEQYEQCKCVLYNDATASVFNQERRTMARHILITPEEVIIKPCQKCFRASYCTEGVYD